MQEEDNMLKSFFRKKWVIGVLVVDILVVVALIALAIMNSMKVSVLVFDIAPVDATILVNGRDGYTNNGTYNIAPGKYEVQISHDGLTTKNLTVEIPANYYVTVATFLSDDGGFDYYTLAKNTLSFEKLKSIVNPGDNYIIDNDDSAKEFVEDYTRQWEIFNSVFPIDETDIYLDESIPDARIETIGVYLDINHDNSCELTFCINAYMYKTKDKELVRNALKKVGLNPDYVDIKYNGL